MGKGREEKNGLFGAVFYYTPDQVDEAGEGADGDGGAGDGAPDDPVGFVAVAIGFGLGVVGLHGGAASFGVEVELEVASVGDGLLSLVGLIDEYLAVGGGCDASGLAEVLDQFGFGHRERRVLIVVEHRHLPHAVASDQGHRHQGKKEKTLHRNGGMGLRPQR